VREDKYAVKRDPQTAANSKRSKNCASARGRTELVILFDDSVKGDAVRKLVEFGQSLGIPVKYCALVDYSNSRGAIDMGWCPELLPGYSRRAPA
jgi:hypothetical protein